jgi:large subunit ribosomal protein L6
MSRIGRMPITVPAGVTVTVAADNVVTVKGPLGTLTNKLNNRMTITQEGNVITVTRPTDEKEDRSIHGLTRALLQNMVTGVSTGYSKTLEIIGVGYKAAKVGKTVELYLRHSLRANGKPQEKFCITESEGITLEVAEKAVPITITVKGIDKQAVGQMAAVIRGKRPPEPYHGKGVKYSDERIRRKAGKTGK